MSRKSEEELKSMVQEEEMYDAAFIAEVREELMERVLGNRVQVSLIGEVRRRNIYFN